MKAILSQTKITAVLLTAFLASSCHTVPKTENAAPSTVMLLIGQARQSVNGNSFKSLKVGDLITPGDLLQTAKGLGELYLYLGEEVTPPEKSSGGGGIYDPALRPANLLELFDGTTLRLKHITTASPIEGRSPRQRIGLILYTGTIQCNVKSNSICSVELTNGVFIMQPGMFRIDSVGNVDLFEGEGEIRLPTQGITKVLTASQKFDAKTGAVTRLVLPDHGGGWRHDIWLRSDPAFMPWAKPESVDGKGSNGLPPRRPF